MGFYDWFNSLRLYRLRKYLIPQYEEIHFDFIDVFLVILLAILSYAIRLRTFAYPEHIVFDEIHFGNFTNFYIQGKHFFDIHPPLAKLIFAGFAYLSEYPANIEWGDSVSLPYPDEGYVPLRITPIMFSSLVPVALYLAMRMAPFSHIASLTSAILITFDTSILAEGKFLLTDGTLHFFTMLSMAVMNYWLAQKRHSHKWWVMLYVSSVFMGMAFSVKNTALSLCFVAGFSQLIDILDTEDFYIDEDIYTDICVRALHVGGPGLVLHILLWYIHIMLLPYIGDESNEDEIKSYCLQPLNSTDLSKWVGFPPVIGRVLNTIASIFMSNGMNFEPHPYMTRPKDWPLLTDLWVGFWSSGRSEINCCGNLFVYYFAFAGVIIAMFSFKRKKYPLALRLVIGYWFSYLPFFGVPRTMFLYHYLIPLMFGAMCLGAVIDMWLPKFWKGFVFVFIVLFVVFGFYMWSPFAYGTNQNEDGFTDNSWRIWNKAWRDGNKNREKWVQKMQNKYDIIEKADQESKLASQKLKEYRQKHRKQ